MNTTMTTINETANGANVTTNNRLTVYSIRRVCAWCGETMGWKAGGESTKAGAITHGICEGCRAGLKR